MYRTASIFATVLLALPLAAAAGATGSAADAASPRPDLHAAAPQPGGEPRASEVVAVGVASAEIVDPTRRDPVDPKFERRWRVDIYYPARASAAAPRAYAPDRALVEVMVADGYYEVDAATLRGWLTKPGPAVAGAVADTPRPAPLVTLSPGWGVAGFNYSKLAAALVRRGYVVAVVDPPYLGISRLGAGRLLRAADDPAMRSEEPASWAPRVREWSRDVSVTIDRLLAGDRSAEIPATLAVDPRRIVVTGHSLGGTVAMQVCSDDSRVEGCANFEGTPEPTTAFRTGPSKPTLMTAARSAKPDRPFLEPALDDPRWSFLAKGGGRSSWAIAITRGSHMSYSDAPAEMPATLSRFGGELMTPARSFEVYTGIVDAFAEAYAPDGAGNAAFGAFLASLPEVKATSSAAARPLISAGCTCGRSRARPSLIPGASPPWGCLPAFGRRQRQPAGRPSDLTSPARGLQGASPWPSIERSSRRRSLLGPR